MSWQVKQREAVQARCEWVWHDVQADIFEHALGSMPCAGRQPHAVVIGTEVLREQHEVAVTAPAVHLRHAALQKVQLYLPPLPPACHLNRL